MSDHYQFIDASSTGDEAIKIAFSNQVAYCRSNGAPQTARIVAAIAAALAGPDDNALLRRLRNWQGAPLADALPLRVAGGLHALHLDGGEPALGTIYRGEAADDDSVVADVLMRRQRDLLPWLDGPPQTNEAGRSSNFIAAMLWLAGKGLPPRFECIEIGSSAGINLMLAHYHYDLAGVTVGPQDAAMRFKPDWKGPPPPDLPIAIVSTRGCDVAPVDLTDPTQALRLRAYIWPEHTARFERMDAAIAQAKHAPPQISRMNAADFVETELGKPQAPGTTRVLMHSIVWQYVPVEQQRRVIAAVKAAGARSTPEAPLAWIALEANRTVHWHELTAQYWPANALGGGEQRLKLGTAHAHGAWLTVPERPEPSAWPDG